ncbi:threonine-phosphate decarboxylase [Metarhizobium album]|uniref:threonine-phosphate decarboxylase n=1 Tax=Metarhizobium album TaxID=2182425 RepID=A0A2U2DTQ3_9HYPH|nr:threonine-phosphate decarboxylase CobD [Rhizobium album]PWE56693.1 threonine-phosphate decarboxylase [Rhizobium album]
MTAAIVHGGGITAAAAAYGGRPQDWLDLSTGINPCPPDLPDIDARAWHRLPDRHLVDTAREAARDYYRTGAVLPLPVPGTQSVIQLLPRLVPAGSRVAILSPTYGEYARAFTMAGLTVDAITELDAVRPEHGLVVVVNPNNPTGQLHAVEALERLRLKLAASGGLLVVDEAFADGARQGASIAADGAKAGLIVFRSFGKFFGMAGVRLGFVVASQDRLALFEQWLGPWAVSGPALAIAAALMRSDIKAISDRITSRKAALISVLEAAGLAVAGGASLFALVDDPRAAVIHDHLCRHHILVRTFDYAPAWLRFGLAPDTEADARLRTALAGLLR